jgi:hypothetical protein
MIPAPAVGSLPIVSCIAADPREPAMALWLPLGSCRAEEYMVASRDYWKTNLILTRFQPGDKRPILRPNRFNGLPLT